MHKKYKITWIYFICCNWYMLKFRLWSNHIPVSQSLSSNLDLKEMRLSVSYTSIQSLRVSTQDQSETVIFNLNFSSPKFSLLNLNEAWIAINTWSFSLIFFFFSSLEFLLAMCYYLILEISKEEAPKLLWTWNSLGCASQGRYV